jgi:hypothetical protein
MHGKDSVPSTGIWLELYNEYNLGALQGSIIILDAKSRVGIAEKVKEITDFDPRKDHYEDLKLMSRTQASKFTNDEKFISLPPREAFVEVRRLTNTYHTPGYQGMLVEDVMSLNCPCFVSVENFDVFTNLQLSDIICLEKLAGAHVCLIYSGDNKASPKAVKKLRELNNKPWVHFGDYDPAGIHIAIARLKATHIIVPNIDAIKTSLALTNKLVFASQYIQLNKLKQIIPASIIPHVEFIKENNIAIMQEQLISHNIPLSLICCIKKQ